MLNIYTWSIEFIIQGVHTLSCEFGLRLQFDVSQFSPENCVCCIAAYTHYDTFPVLARQSFSCLFQCILGILIDSPRLPLVAWWGSVFGNLYTCCVELFLWLPTSWSIQPSLHRPITNDNRLPSIHNPPQNIPLRAWNRKNYHYKIAVICHSYVCEAGPVHVPRGR